MHSFVIGAVVGLIIGAFIASHFYRQAIAAYRKDIAFAKEKIESIRRFLVSHVAELEQFAAQREASIADAVKALVTKVRSII